MKASLTNEAVTTNEGAKTQIADQFLTGFRSRDWALWRSIMLPGIWLTGYRVVPHLPGIRAGRGHPRSGITNTPSNEGYEIHSEEAEIIPSSE
jgi:hypothetical protein